MILVNSRIVNYVQGISEEFSLPCKKEGEILALGDKQIMSAAFKAGLIFAVPQGTFTALHVSGEGWYLNCAKYYLESSYSIFKLTDFCKQPKGLTKCMFLIRINQIVSVETVEWKIPKLMLLSIDLGLQGKSKR